MILGAILAGGESRRFGTDKAAALLDGQRMIDHVAAALRPYAADIVVCGGDRAGYRCLPDVPVTGLGPLGGLCAALTEAATRGFTTVLSLPCDTPVLEPALLDTLSAASGATYLAGLPVIGRWPVSLAAPLRAWLATTDDRSMRRWTTHIAATPLACDPPRNVNTPDDLRSIG